MTSADGWRKRRDFDFSTPRCHDLAMELRHLRTIEAVARHGSLTKAGEELYLSQFSHLAADPPARVGARLRGLPAHEPPRRAHRRGAGDPRVRAARPGRGRRPALRARGDD